MRPNKTLIRIVFDIVLLFLAVSVPWYASGIFGLVGTAMFVDYFEILALAIIIDAVQFGGSVGHIPFLFMVIGAVIFFVMNKIRNSILNLNL
jgi:hypothetical protein